MTFHSKAAMVYAATAAAGVDVGPSGPKIKRTISKEEHAEIDARRKKRKAERQRKKASRGR